ncbi:STAS domain-containing protein [Streptomyces sp. NPDC088341]|uniref:STAS domain-containing protein n=1 Tax=Streptomyces sp. NPDC088341 TaxID=3154870 RepID=UPI003417B010
MDITEPIVLVIEGRLTPADVPRLCEELTARLYGTEAAEAICDVGGLGPPNLAAVEAVARLHLIARRHGCRIRLRGVGGEMRLLLDLVGLSDLAGTLQETPGTGAGAGAGAATGTATGEREGEGGESR